MSVQVSALYIHHSCTCCGQCQSLVPLSACDGQTFCEAMMRWQPFSHVCENNACITSRLTGSLLKQALDKKQNHIFWKVVNIELCALTILLLRQSAVASGSSHVVIPMSRFCQIISSSRRWFVDVQIVVTSSSHRCRIVVASTSHRRRIVVASSSHGCPTVIRGGLVQTRAYDMS